MLARRKKTYKTLSPVAKRFIKLNERDEDLTKTINYFFQVVYKEGYQPPKHTPQLPILDKIGEYMKERDRVWKQRDRLVTKYQLDEDKILHYFCELNR